MDPPKRSKRNNARPIEFIVSPRLFTVPHCTSKNNCNLENQRTAIGMFKGFDARILASSPADRA
jgi:hypothetical protein